jgi:hypothetical protein
MGPGAKVCRWALKHSEDPAGVEDRHKRHTYPQALKVLFLLRAEAVTGKEEHWGTRSLEGHRQTPC